MTTQETPEFARPVAEDRARWRSVLLYFPKALAFVLPKDATVAYRIAAVVALAAVWLYPHPVGVDLPQHANLFQLLSNYWDESTGYRFFYELDFFTPYAVLYLLAWPLTKAFGALVATKSLLTLCVLATPAAMTRWLRKIGGEPSLGIVGFALVFGYGYQWGFISFVLAMPLALLYVGEVHTLLEEHGWRQRLVCAGLAVALFFTHGILFGFTMVSAGLACLFQRRLRVLVLDALHFVPVAAVLVLWRFLHAGAAANLSDFPDSSWFALLFSGAVSGHASFLPAVCAFAGFALLFAVGRPRLSHRPLRVIPLVVASIGFFTIPEWVADTWLVGPRFVVFIHFFGLGAFDFTTTTERGKKSLRAVAFALVLVTLGGFHQRMRVFTRELDGLEQVRALIPPGDDVQLFTSQHTSESFGRDMLGQVVGWIPAAQGGILENDSAKYYQMPVQHRAKVPRPSEYRWFVARGTEDDARSAVGAGPRLVASRGNFHLFEPSRTKISVPGMALVRFAQGWGHLHGDRSVDGNPLSVAGTRYSHGLGTHAASVLEMRLAPGMRRLRGEVGVDDEAPRGASITFLLMTSARKVLWSSPAMALGDAPCAFDVLLSGAKGDAFLVVEGEGENVQGAHADWLSLEAAP